MRTLSQMSPASQLAWLLVALVVTFFLAAWIFVEVKILPLRLQNTLLRNKVRLKKLYIWYLLGRIAKELGTTRALAKDVVDRMTPEKYAEMKALIEAERARRAQITPSSD